MDDGLSHVQNGSELFNETIAGCPSPLVPWIALTRNTSSLNRRCMSGCCVKYTENSGILDISMMNYQLSYRVLSLTSFVLATLIFLPHVVNPRLTVNKYAGLQAFSIMFLSVSLVISNSLSSESKKLWYDQITQTSGGISPTCLTQGCY